MITRQLGRGASATVYLAHDSKQDREIALKVLDSELANALGAKRFLQEIHITSRLQHPHILPIHDSGEWQGMLYYVLPFVSGESLRARLEREKQLPIEECVQLACDVASALSHAHAKGVIHRDIKPENILLSDGHALVADFGIARTIDIHTGERLTSSGLIVGTSQYMSPEQASGEREIDARSDIYSLGCVLYEMLAGIEPFVGPNVRAVIAQRFTHTPRPVRTYRPTTPDYLVETLEKALAIAPADRFQSMKEFAAALPAATGAPADRRRLGRPLRDFVRSHNGRIALGLFLVIVAASVAAIGPANRRLGGFFRSGPAPDSAMYVVLLSSNSGTPSGADLPDMVQQSLMSWNDLKLVPAPMVEETVRKSGSPATVSDAIAIARDLGAGRLIWGGSRRLQLYDALNSTQLNQVEVSTSDTVAFRAAVMKLLRGADRPAGADGGDGMTRSFSAWQAYGRGHSALRRWNVQGALENFKRAATLDPDYVPARLWYAQSYAWMMPDSVDVWGPDATFAASRRQVLSARDNLVAGGLGALAARDYPRACAEYRRLTELDSMDVVGWYGLGECQARDQLVVPLRASATGLRFRSSFRAAAADYNNAIRLDPGAHAIVTFERMRRLQPMFPFTPRRGVDSAGFVAYAAYPSIENDTLAFVPYRLKEFAALSPTVLRFRNAAMDRNARDLFDFASAWTRAESNSSDAFEALAVALEARGEVAAHAARGLSASEAIARARALSRKPEQRVRLVASEVRLRVKRLQFSEANALADSILSSSHEPGTEAELMAVSALTGRINSLHRLAEQSRSWLTLGADRLSFQPALVSTAAELFARAALGDCGERPRALEARFANQLESFVEPEKRESIRQILLGRSFSMLSPCTGGASSLSIANPQGSLVRAQQQFARRNSAGARAILDSIVMRQSSSRPGDLSPDFIFHQAWIRAALGDTAGAVGHLDRAFTALPTMGASSLREPAAAAALGRMMILRAEIAAKQGDRATASKWGAYLRALWKGADPELAPFLSRMKY